MQFQPVQPEEIGVSTKRLERAGEYAQNVGEALGCSGGATIILRHGKVLGEWYWGMRSFSPDRHPFDSETLVPLASVTKAVTGTALSLLIQDGLIWLDDPVCNWFPELSQGSKAQITIRHLVTHSSGFPPGDPDWYASWKDKLPEENIYEPFVRHALARVTRELMYEPGTSFIYSDPAVCLLGELIYRATGKRVPEIASERIFNPLGLENIGWDFKDDRVYNISFSVADHWAGSYMGTKEARQYQAVGGGLIGNARDLATFGQMLLQEGEIDGERVVAPMTIRMMTSCQMPLPARSVYPNRGVLWFLKASPDSPEMGSIVPYGTYAHGGASHCLLVIMPALDIVAVMLRNRIGDPPGFNYVRDYPVFMDLVAASVDHV